MALLVARLAPARKIGFVAGHPNHRRPELVSGQRAADCCPETSSGRRKLWKDVLMNIASTMPFSALMGVEVTSAAPDAVTGTLTVRPDLCTAGHILHGGAIMAFADALGAVGAFLTLPEGAKGTTTIESKTNFLGAAPEGSVVTGTATPVKIGRTLSVWQTRITIAEGRDVALVTQTQMVL
jgi:1,4-dihydroxy-2-naphthoyl-CoA hydrolase